MDRIVLPDKCKNYENDLNIFKTPYVPWFWSWQQFNMTNNIRKTLIWKLSLIFKLKSHIFGYNNFWVTFIFFFQMFFVFWI